MKFEENVEEGGVRWSKPHVATLCLHSVTQLRSYIENGAVLLDMLAENVGDILDLVIENWVQAGSVLSSQATIQVLYKFTTLSS